MNLDDEFTILLAHNDNDDEMQNDEFVDTVMLSIRQQRMRRRVMLALVGSLTTVAAVLAWAALPLSVLSGPPVDMRSTMALLVLAALSGVAWLQTETHLYTR